MFFGVEIQHNNEDECDKECSPPSWTDESNSRDQDSALQAIVEFEDIFTNDVYRVQFKGK